MKVFELFAELGLDNKTLERGIARSEARSKASTKRMEANFGNIQRASDDAGDSISDNAKRNEKDTKSLGKQLGILRKKLGGTAGDARLLGRIWALIKWPAIITGAHLAATAIAATGAAAVSLASALAPLGGFLASYPGLLAAGAQGMGVFKLATMGVSDALKAAAKGEAEFKEALKELPPGARAFTRELAALIPKVEMLRRTAAREFFDDLAPAIKRVSTLLPMARRLIGDTADELGDLAAQGARMVTAGPFARDLETIGRRNVVVIGRLGRAGLILGDAMRHVMVAAGPFVAWLSRSVVQASKAARAFFAHARATGSLADFLEQTRWTGEKLWAILTNIGKSLVNVFRAGQPMGRWLLRSFEGITAQWEKFSSSIEGQRAIEDWFARAKPVMVEMGRLVAAIVKGFASFTDSADLAPLVRQIRTRLLPAVLDLFRSTSGKLGPALVDLATSFARLFTIFGTETGVLITFVKGVGRLADVLATLLENTPGVQAFIVPLAAFAGIMRAVKFVGWITGLSTVLGLLRKIPGAAASAGAAASGAAALGGGGAAAGAAANRTFGRLAVSGGAAGTAAAAGGRGVLAMATQFARAHPVLLITTATLAKIAVDVRAANKELDAAKGTVARFGTESDRSAGALQRLGVDMDNTRQQIQHLKDQGFKEGSAEVQRLREAMEDQRGELKRLQKTHAGYLTTLTGSKAATQDYIDLTRNAAQGTERQRERVRELVSGMKTLGVRIGDTTQRQVANLLSMGDWSGAIQLLKERLREGTRNLGGWGSQAAIARDRADEARIKSEGLGAAVKSLPRSRAIRISAPGLAEVSRQLGYTLQQMRELARGVTARVNLNLGGSGASAVNRDRGGTVRGPALVGVGAGVVEDFIPRNRGAAAATGAGVNITVPVRMGNVIGVDDLADQLIRAMRNRIAMSGGRISDVLGGQG